MSSHASRSSPGARALSTLLALSGLVLALALGLGPRVGELGGALRPLGLAGEYLAASFSWAALCLPLWFFASALLAWLPGFRPAAIFGLALSVLPFLVLALFARISVDPQAWFSAIPALESFGLPALGVVAGLLVLFLSLLVARLSLLLFPLEPGPAEADAEAERPGPPTRLLTGPGGPARASAPAAAKVPSTTSSKARRRAGPELDNPDEAFTFRVPNLPPAPHLTCIPGEARDEEDIPDLESAEPVEGPKTPETPQAPGEKPINLVLGADRKAAAQTAQAAAQAPKAGPGASLPLGAAIALAPAASLAAPGSGTTAGNDGETLVSSGPALGARVIEFTSVPPAHPMTAEEAAAEEAKAEALRRVLARRKPRNYAVPVDGLLNTYPDGQYWIIDEKTRHSAEVLQETLAEFNIKAEVTGIRKGPVITMFEILPAPGVRLSKIANLSDNIALRLAASSVRIVAPIPGKHAVGIEVPNERRSIVSLREIVDNEAFKTAKMEIPVILGKDIAGEAQFIDLVQTPHLLIAGATGSGKSVCVNSIILSILFRRSPEEVRLILIDPKIVELKLYNDVPHLLTPVITEPKRAFQALQYCICEMERRYSMLDHLGVRDIKSYNRKIKDKGYVQERLPYIVVVVDEFADLMATTGKELESTLARLAAMSRAVGIHLVLATQRPSIDVITGLIKANIPSRIAFMVASKFDSRIIIDMVGAEKLLGRGDMLFASAWDPFPIRMQGAFVSEEEVEKSVEFVKTLGEPDYIDEEIFIDEDEDDDGPSLFDDGEGDPLFEQALEIVLSQGKASASYIQRKLKIGYNRAARLVELMEERGIVGPAQGSKPRDIVRNPEVLGRGSSQGPHRASQASLLPGLETLPGEGISTAGARASGGGLASGGGADGSDEDD